MRDGRTSKAARWGRMAAAAAGLLAFALTGCAQVRVEPTHYGMWKDAVRVTNGQTDLVVVPTGGRVIRYGPVGGPNLLWENPAAQAGKDEYGWHNYGGDKIWIWPQDAWGKLFVKAWPPPEAVDQGTYTITPIANGVKLESPVEKEVGLRVVREITLAADSNRVTSRTELERVGKAVAMPVAAWEVTQVHNPQAIVVRTVKPFTPTTTRPASGDEPWLGIHPLADGLWDLPRPEDKSVKEFFPGDLVVGMTQGYALVEHVVQPDPATAAEPTVQVYTDRQHDPARPASVPSYCEFEFTSPRQSFAAGQPAIGPASVVEWTYHALPAGKLAPAELGQQVEEWAKGR